MVMKKTAAMPSAHKGFSSERGAALITSLYVTVLLMLTGAALLVSTTMSATNTVDSKSEIQAYYAAEAGLQQTLNVLRGNVAPNPVFASNPSGGIADENKISFRRALNLVTSNSAGDTSSTPRLSHWLTYNSDRVLLPGNNSGFSTALTDPDNTALVTFSVSGYFTNYGTGITSHQFGSGGNRMTIGYTAPATTTINLVGNSTFGTFQITSVNGGGTAINNEPFRLVVTQTAPFAQTLNIDCKINATSSSDVTITFPTQSNNLQGANYARSSNPISITTSASPIAVNVTAPDPTRLIARIVGYGPRAAQKQMQMLLSRFAFDYTAVGLIAIRSADDGSLLTFNAGSSSQYGYNGNDNAGGQNITAFAVTSSQDYNYLNGLTLPSGQVTGSPSGFSQVSVSSLSSWLQTADAARAMVAQLRYQASINGRYFTSASPPASYGTSSQPLLTFIDGDSDLPPAGGAGLLVVTGTFAPRGSAAFSGLILVLGGGVFDRSGGGNGNSLGSVVVARFGASGNFLAPTFNSNGSGTSYEQYDSVWATKALGVVGPRVLAVSEY
jgi:hypothetical protein